MQNFKDWINEKHPEYQINEVQFPSWLRKTVAPAVAAAGLMGAGTASAADPVQSKPAATAQTDNSITITKSYDFDDNEDIRDAVEEATMEIKAKIAKKYGTNVLSGIGRPQVKIDRKSRIVKVTIQVPQKISNMKPTVPTPSNNSPSVQKRVSRSDF